MEVATKIVVEMMAEKDGFLLQLNDQNMSKEILVRKMSEQEDVAKVMIISVR